MNQKEIDWQKKIAKIFKEKSINRLHYITSEPFGGYIYKFGAKKKNKINKMNSAEFMEFVFSKSGSSFSKLPKLCHS